MATQDRARRIETAVLIVGCGPVGMALAIDLGLRGVSCVAVEQGSGLTDHPKASAINARSMEFFRRWGIAEAVKDASTPDGFPQTALYCTSLNGFEIARIERPHHGGRGPSKDSPERPQRCNQLWLDPILRAKAESLPDVRLLYRHRFDALEERTQDVVARVTDLDLETPVEIAARYVVDCSGGHSLIRRAFGIAMRGGDHVGYHVSLFVRAPELWRHHAMGKAALIHFVEPRGAWRNLVLLDGGELYRLGLRDRAAYDAPQEIDRERMFREVIGADAPHEFLSVGRWTARNVVAERYRIGRVFLAGDAAHLNHPASGIGLNTGLGDAVDLGWKLAATLAGWGGPGLLDSYEPERRAVGARNIAHADASHVNDRDLAPHAEIAMDTPAGSAARLAMGAAIRARQTKKFISDGLALGYRYAGSPIVASKDGPGADTDDPGVYLPSAAPGARAPHAFLADGRSTLDLFGDGFALLRFGGDPEPPREAFASRGAPLAITAIEDAGVAALYGRALALVRPDGHVAWRGDDPPADPGALAALVCGG